VHRALNGNRAIILAILVLTTTVGALQAHEDDSDTHVDSAVNIAADAGWTVPEKQSGRAHVLAMTQIRQLATINDGLTALAQRDAAACRWMNQITGPETLARQVRAFDANPAVKSVIEAHMSIRDYLLALHAVSETAIAVHAMARGLQVPASPSAINIAFYRKHQPEIEQLLDAPDPC
jgi:hypothetical protein